MFISSSTPTMALLSPVARPGYGTITAIPLGNPEQKGLPSWRQTQE